MRGFKMFEGFDEIEAIINSLNDGDEDFQLYVDHCDSEMVAAIDRLEMGDTVGASIHVLNALDIFSNCIIKEPFPVDPNIMAQSIVYGLISNLGVGVDAIIEQMEEQFA
jgi:hypothetical protein